MAVKSYILILLLFIACVLIITPVSIVDNLLPLINYITNRMG